MHKAIGVFAATALVTALFVGNGLAIPLTSGNSDGQVAPQNHLRLAQGQCHWQGPYVTQSTAWQRWRNARDQGYEISNGVDPCWDRGDSGYCFNIFHYC